MSSFEPISSVSLEVVVTDSHGVVTDAWVSLDPLGRDAHTDIQGIAHFPRIDPGVAEAIVAAPGHAVASQRVVIDDTGGQITVRLKPQPTLARLSGHVHGPDGSPLAEATIWLDGGLLTQTRPNGSWSAEAKAGSHTLQVQPPTGSPLLPWTSPFVSLAVNQHAQIDTVLPGGSQQGTSYLGSYDCGICHTDQATSHTPSPHATTRRSPADASGALQPLADAVQSGVFVPLAQGASVNLISNGGSWQLTLSDRVGAQHSGEIVALIGGHRTGVAFVLDDGSSLRVAPLAWAMAGGGLSSRQLPAGFIPAYQAGWFDASGLLDPTAQTSFDLRCAGCHATGATLQASGSDYSLDANEDQIGCEACHGPGGAHTAILTDPSAVNAILNPSDLPGTERVELCARCHEQVSPDTHPFLDTPGWATDAAGAQLTVAQQVGDYSTPNPTLWAGVDTSRVAADQVGDFRRSPHQRGAGHYAGACTDCHDPHSTELRSPIDSPNELCTGCHASRFPSGVEQQAHAQHSHFDPSSLWGPGNCVGCHMPRSATQLRPDAVSGAGELRAHSLWPASPDVALAEFDDAGLNTLPLGQVPSSGCLDCHLQVNAERSQAGSVCECPTGHPMQRQTYADLGALYTLLFGGSP